MSQVLIISLIFIIILIIIVKKSSIGKVEEKSYQNYTQFFGEKVVEDPKFIKKVKIIYSQIIKYRESDIKTIAELAGCTYTECIIKIRYLKQLHKLSDNYYVDEVNGLVNICSKEDQLLLKKYRPYIYRNHLQIPQIATKLPGTTTKNKQEVEKKILEELSYLDDKDLINGIILNRVDGTITYYNTQKNKHLKDKITINCPNCGAPTKVNRGGKAWCEYCGSIVEDKEKVIINNS